MRILLCYSMGTSTSIVVAVMKRTAAEQGKNYQISVTDVNSVDEEDKVSGVILVGPQVAHALKQVQEQVSGADVEAAVMSKTDYGNVDGAAILKFTEEIAGV